MFMFSTTAPTFPVVTSRHPLALYWVLLKQTDSQVWPCKVLSLRRTFQRSSSFLHLIARSVEISLLSQQPGHPLHCPGRHRPVLRAERIDRFGFPPMKLSLLVLGQTSQPTLVNRNVQMIQNLSGFFYWVSAQVFKEHNFQFCCPIHPIFYELAPPTDGIEHKFSEFWRAKRQLACQPSIILSFLPVPKRNNRSVRIPDHENSSPSKCLNMHHPPGLVLVSRVVGEYCPEY